MNNYEITIIDASLTQYIIILFGFAIKISLFKFLAGRRHRGFPKSIKII